MSSITTTVAWHTATFNAPLPNSVPNDTLFVIEVVGGAANCMISQKAYKDFFGTPILLPNRNYVMRFQASKVSE
jgi:hypothetical protein